MVEKADTTILVRMEKARLDTSERFQKERLGARCVADLAWKDLLNNASLSERGVVFAMSTGLSRSSHPRAGWGYASYTTGTAPRCPLFLLLLCVLFVKLRTGGKNKKASSTSASGVLCREALRTSYKRRPFLRHPNSNLPTESHHC